MQFNSLVPELYVLDFQKSLNFYVSILGFAIEYQRKEPKFAFLSYLDSQIMIQEDDDNDKDWHTDKLEYPFGRGINFQIKANDVQQLANKLEAANYPLKMGLKD